MSRYPLLFALVLGLTCVAVPLHSAQQPKRVWTTDDMADLSARGLISIVGTEAETVTTPAAAPAPTPGPVYASRTDDPGWYADQTADLQAQLSARRTALTQAQDNLAQARDLRGTTGSFNMAAGETIGVTPEDVIANLEAQMQDTQSSLDDVAELARMNGIAPGVLRTPA